MGIEEISDSRSTRRSTRSSVKVQTPTPATPPITKAATPSTSRRGKKKKAEEEDVEAVDEGVVVEKVSPKTSTPPRKRQKLADVINEEEKKLAEKSKSDEVDAPSQEANGTDETMEVDDEPMVAEVPSKGKGKSLVEGDKKKAVETIPEEEEATEVASSSVVEETAVIVKKKSPPPQEKESSPRKEVKAPKIVEKASKSVAEGPVEAMEVDSAKSAAKPVVSEMKESPPAIVISAPESEPQVTAAVEAPKPTEVEPVDQQISSTSEKKDGVVVVQETVTQVPEVKSASVSELATKTSEPVAEVVNEPTQVFEISSDNQPQTKESVSPAKPASGPIETLPTESITEQSKIEATQGESRIILF